MSRSHSPAGPCIGVLGVLMCLIIGIWERPADSANATITVNPQVTYQTMTGWEATLASWINDPGRDTYVSLLPSIIDQAVDDLGINRVRLAIKSGAENTVDPAEQFYNGQIDNATYRCLRYATVNDNSDPTSINMAGFQFWELDRHIEHYVLPMKQRLEARGEQLYINVNYVAFTNQICAGGHYHHGNPDEYAEFVLATYQHMQSTYGLVPNAWEVILEPDNVVQWRSGTTIGNAIAKAAVVLQAHGFTPRFIAPSTTSMGNAPPYFDAMIQVPGVLPYVKELSYHRYKGGSLPAIASRAVNNGVNAAMLEHIGSGYQDLHADVKEGRNSAWQQYTLTAPSAGDDGGKYYPISSPTTFYLGSRTKFLRQYFKFIRRGAQRIGASSTSGTFDPLAFINTNGGTVVVVKATGDGSFDMVSLPAGTYGIKYTTNSHYDIDLADIGIGSGQALTTTIPAAGVITIYGKSGGPPVPDTMAPAAPTAVIVE